MNYAKHFSTLNTPQSRPADSSQVQNSSGCYVVKLDPKKQLERFLILGTDGGSYYASEQKLTIDNAQVVVACLDQDPVGTVETIASISETGRATKNDPAIFALAIAAGHKSDLARAAALRALPRVCRIGTHLFQFAEQVQAMRGWGRGLKRAVANWYNDKSVKDVMFQVAKYGQRNGWSHRDLFRLSHPVSEQGERQSVYRYITTGSVDGNFSFTDSRFVKGKLGETADRTYPLYDSVPAYLQAFEQLKKTRDPKEAVFLIREWKFTHEMVPSEVKNTPDVWAALLENMPPTALIRNLAKMTSVGLISPLSQAAIKVSDKLTNQDSLRRGKVHPISLLSALKVYSQGHGEKGSLTWKPNQKVVDALNEAFYLAFGVIEPTNKATMLAIDVSGSMTYGNVAGLQGITPRDASAAFAMVAARTEKNYHIAGFSGGMRDLKISPNMRLDDVLRVMNHLPFDSTDCSLPIRWAHEYNVGVEVFHVYTDSDTNHGNSIQAHQALVNFRKKTGIPAKLAVMAMVANPYTIANPNDPGMIDVVGIDSSVPQILHDFATQ